MSDIVRFIKDRLDDDEAVAKAAVPAAWEDTGPILAGVVADRGMVTIAVCNRSDFDGGEYSYPAETEEAARSVHIARHDPARVLREVEAKRMVVRLAQMTVGVATMPAILRCLAMPYSDHPDCQEEWRL